MRKFHVPAGGKRATAARSSADRPIVQPLENRRLLNAALTTLLTFNTTNGATPYGSLIADQAGNLFGTTEQGGASGGGTVFELSGTNHQTFTILLSFNGANGEQPFAGLLIDGSGDLFGVTSAGGDHDDGAVFELSGANHQNFNLVVSFNGDDGRDPRGALIADNSGNLYGTTAEGGDADMGTVFELSGTAHQSVTTLISFNANTGALPEAGLVADAAGNLYGTLSIDGPGTENDGTVFELSGADHRTLTTLVEFTFANGADPLGPLTIDASGDLFGVTSTGYGPIPDGTTPSAQGGTVFELSGAGHQILTMLHSFGGGNGDGDMPIGGVVLDANGNLYGTTQLGGAGSGLGTIFMLSGNDHSTLTILASFDGSDNGQDTQSDVYLDNTGNLFTVAADGGTNSVGTIVQIPAAAATGKSGAVFSNGILTISGTADPDTISVTDNAGSVFAVINGNISPIFTGVSGVTIGGAGGDDSISLAGVPINATLGGAGGDDSLTGGAGADSLKGGQGDDLIAGGGNADTIIGGAGDDSLRGGGGNDLIAGGPGDDSLHGGQGDDTLTGGIGFESVSGNEGNDSITAGSGLGILLGGPGNDTILGAILPGYQSNQIDPGGGSDSIHAGASDVLSDLNANDTIVQDH